MAGLLEALDSALSGSGLSGEISSRVGQLGDISTAVQALTQGPAALGNLRDAAAALPLPPGLGGIATLSTSLSTLSVPSDFSAILQPILGPITGLSSQLAGGAAGRITATFDLVREITRLATGRATGGPSGMPGEAGFRLPDAPDVAELRALFAEGNRMLDGFGPRLDAARLLDLLQRASSAFQRPLFRLPHLPLLDDVMVPLGTVASWQVLTPDQLTAHVARTVDLAAQLIAMPRQRVARPVMEAAESLVNGRSNGGGWLAELIPVSAALRSKLESDGGKPSPPELVAVETAAARLESLAGALDPAGSPLGQVDTLDEELTRALLGVVRAFQPAFDLAPLAANLRERLAGFSSAPDNAFDEAVAAINDFDLAALTDPLQTVTQTVRQVVDQVNAAKDQVRQALEGALSPVGEALDSALQAAQLQEVHEALEGLPARVRDFVDTQITPNLDSVRDGIGGAVEQIVSAADQFHPEELIQPIRDAVQQAADLLQSDEIKGTFAQLDQALNSAVEAIENLDLSAAADESIELIDDIKEKVSAIDPAKIPDAAKPLLRQGVQVVTDVDFTGEVGAPLLGAIEQGLQQGPGALLGALEGQMDELRARLEAFRPSQTIGAELDQPFEQLLGVLRRFKPSDLFNELQHALDQLASRLQVLDVASVVNPLIELHTTIRAQVEVLRPSNLLRPVDEAIAAAIEKVYQVTGIDSIFDGIHEVLDTVQTWVGLLADARDLLARGADLFEQPGDASAAVQQLVGDAVARLDTVDMSKLQSAFNAAAAAVAGADRNALAGDVARALQTAGENGPALLTSAPLGEIQRLIRAFPMTALEQQPDKPAWNRLAEAMRRLQSAADRIDAARSAWPQLGPKLIDAAGRIQERLLDYYRVTQLDGGGVFAGFATPPATTAQLKETVRVALTDAVQEPIATLLEAFRLLSPYLRLLARGVSQILGALHDKVNSIVGDEGVGGTVNAIEEAANLLRGINLRPITDPLDAIYRRIEDAVNALDPEPLRSALQAVQDAVLGLLNVTTLVRGDDIQRLDDACATALQRLGQLAPSAVISQTLDPVYEDLLQDVLPVLDLPKKLRGLMEKAGRTLRDDALRELARVELAFDEMLRAIPLDDTGSGVSAEASVSVGVG